MPDFLVKKPGLFITGTDTGVGKTVVTCAIAANLRRRGLKVGVCKPYATGCRRDREGLVNEDAEALAHFADCRLPLATINPVRYRTPLAPAVAAERESSPVEADQEIARSLRLLGEVSDVMLVEGIGGLYVPLDNTTTVVDLMRRIGYPAVVVTRATLGTLNHTAMTCRLIRECGLRIAGLVVNRFHVDTPDIAEALNPRWLARQNRTSILATLADQAGVEPHRGRLPEAIIEAAGMIDWRRVCQEPVPV